jgi:hypothetical protein
MLIIILLYVATEMSTCVSGSKVNPKLWAAEGSKEKMI